MSPVRLSVCTAHGRSAQYAAGRRRAALGVGRGRKQDDGAFLAFGLDLLEALGEREPSRTAGDAEEATSQYALALKLDPENAEAQRGLARTARIDEVFALLRAGEKCSPIPR